MMTIKEGTLFSLSELELIINQLALYQIPNNDNREDVDITKQLDNLPLPEKDELEAKENNPPPLHARKARESETDNGNSATFSAIQRLINANNGITVDDISNALDMTPKEVKNFMRTVMALIYVNGQWVNYMGREWETECRLNAAGNEEVVVAETLVNKLDNLENLFRTPTENESANNEESDVFKTPENISMGKLRNEEDWGILFGLPAENGMENNEEDDIFKTSRNNLDRSLNQRMTDLTNSPEKKYLKVDSEGFDVSETLLDNLKSVIDWNESFRLPTEGELENKEEDNVESPTRSMNSGNPETKLENEQSNDWMPQLNVSCSDILNDLEYSFKVPTEGEVEFIRACVQMPDNGFTREQLAELLNMTETMVNEIVDHLQLEAHYINQRTMINYDDYLGTYIQ